MQLTLKPPASFVCSSVWMLPADMGTEALLVCCGVCQIVDQMYLHILCMLSQTEVWGLWRSR